MARPKKELSADAQWQITAKHTSGMQFKGYVSEERFRQIQAIIFGQEDLPLDVKE